MDDRRPDPVETFESELREWAGRPPRTAPAHAATRIVAALPLKRRIRGWWRPALAGAVVVVLSLTLWLAPRSETPHLEANGSAAAPLDENVVLWWLDEDTPVYFVLSPVSEHQESAS